MASTITLQKSIDWVQPFLNYAPVSIGSGLEPALSSANTILQTILAPPFKWRWNRKSLTFNTIISSPTQDYSVATADFGFPETASVALTGAQTFPLEIKSVISEATEQSRPEFISVQKDDDAGNITFRVLPVPDQIYTVTINYQMRAPLFTSLSGLWTPIPDFMEYIYNWGFLSIMQDYIGMGAAARTRQLFVASLLSASEGLDETEKNLFIASWLGQVRQMDSNQLNTQTGSRARAF